ncbi:hypothetical protein HYH02_007838 [Chlamydomonas schloesseri]|uniref:(S)-ureidoglycine aminohydrolase cupin domain-containing protein n=1 Tax=Chlamydomonas schloesseri TaxID=2026947 RepID=A0A835WGC9_9CHLO|nr:hypothetical protein HYH02_007838 [Chlamydomonas schloesseri]|eukprot:KAG2447089.1 hypothetical protein HYH02_007838 [Chlamydomonas schloesseri]
MLASRSVVAHRPSRAQVQVRASAKAAMKIVVQRNPSEEVLKAKGVHGWPTWGCGVSKFPWTYQESETCYVLEGDVIVTPNGGEPVQIKAGDMATFPAGMSCTWDVKSPINKHYNFH